VAAAHREARSTPYHVARRRAAAATTTRHPRVIHASRRRALLAGALASSSSSKRKEHIMPRNRFTLVASTILAAAALAACGDDETGSGGAGGDSSGTESASTGTPASSGTGTVTTSSSSGGSGGSGGTGGAAPGNIYEIASSLPDYSSLVAAVDKAGLAGALQDESATLTVFAPDNDAFAALLESIGAESLDDVTVEQLTPILLYHVLGTEVDGVGVTAAANDEERLVALGGQIDVTLDGEDLSLDGRAVVEVADVQASNGIIHGIDGVLLPSIADVATTTPAFSSLVTALVAADEDPNSPGLVDALDTDGLAITVFAPTNDAFDALVNALGTGNTGIAALGDFAPYQLLPVLKYHAILGSAVRAADVEAGPITTLGGTLQATLAGGGVQVDGVSVVTADILTSNGVIHIIDDVLIPSIVDVATTAPELTGLRDAVLAADGAAGTSPKVSVALDAPAGVGAYTIFAPDNDAFAALGGGAPSGQALTNVLLYHVVNGAAPVFAADALELEEPTTLDTLRGNTTDFEIIVSAAGDPPDSVVIDDAGSDDETTVTAANYFTSNGVLHIVDKVLLPGAE
jgi:transforming growth factor-beta-induced protein